MTDIRFDAAPNVLPSLSATHTLYRISPAHDPSLAYRILVPKGWGVARTLDAPPGVTGRPERIGYFSGPDRDPQQSITVSATRLPWEVDALEWVCARWVIAGWKIVLRHWLDERRFEIGALLQHDADVFVRRTTGFVSDGRIVRVDADTRSGDWARLHDALWPVGALFGLEAGLGRDAIEARALHKGPWVRFELPQSWTAHATSHGEAIRWQAWPERDAQIGVVLVVEAGPVVAPTPSDAEVLRDLAQRGILLGSERIPLSSRSASGWTDGWKARATHDREALEVRFVSRVCEGVQAHALLVCPAPGANHLDWLRGTRAHTVVLRSLRTPCGETEHAPTDD